MHAAKRKFNTILQGLNNPPPPSDGPSPGRNVDYETLLQKRRRLGFPESTAPKRDLLLGGTKNIAPQVKQSVKSTDTWSDAPARYSPNDRDDLLKRLATFQEITDWTPKPEEINEVEWAKRGWVCRGKERVRCLLCHKELVVKLKKDETDGNAMNDAAVEDLERAMVKKYAELIVTSHQSDCLWRRQGCDDSLLRVSFINTKVVIDQLKQRYKELCSRHAFLPYEFNIRLPEDMDLDDVIQQLPSDFFSNEMDSERPNRPALALALLGWQGLTNSRIGAVPNSASCHTCLRRLGLWMFKSKEVDEQGHVVVPAPMDHLDPVREHRFFCPWKHSNVQSRGKVASENLDETAWKILLQSIKNDSDLRCVYEGRARSPTKMSRKPLTAPSTPARATAAWSGVDATPETSPHKTLASVNMNDEDEAERNAKDKERWARLRKVKSLFDMKKLRRPVVLRPGTSPTKSPMSPKK